MKEPKLAPSTADLYRYLLRRHVVPHFAETPVGRITPVDVQEWLAELHRSDLADARRSSPGLLIEIPHLGGA